MIRTFVTWFALAATAQSAVSVPFGAGAYKLAFPHTKLEGGTAAIPLAGPPAGLEVLQTTLVVNYTSPHGGTPASELILELTLPGLPLMTVSGADLGWPAAVGAFSGSFTSNEIAGVLVGNGDLGTQLSIHSTTGGVIGQVRGSALLEVAAICQKDAGYAGPGNVQLSICGDPLFKGGHADLVVSGAPPSAPMLFMAGLIKGPMPFKGGLLAPIPRLVTLLAKGDNSGVLHVSLPGGGAHVIFLLQVAVPDPAQTNGVALSNALIVELLN